MTLHDNLYSAEVNGITVRFCDVGPRDGPLILFMHGWPESWWSWRHQLMAMAQHGYRSVAPDMRGYGGTTTPADFRDYHIHRLAGDAIGLVNHLGYEACLLVGHDWGAWLSWQLALLHPKVFVALAVLSVPHTPRGRVPPLQRLKAKFGDAEADPEHARFFYQLANVLPGAAEGYDSNIRESLYRILCSPNMKSASMSSADAHDTLTPPEVKSDRMFVNGRLEPFWRRLWRPRKLPPWLTETDLDYFVEEFERGGGFAGPLRWYEVQDLNWELTAELEGQKVQPPCMFLAGNDDPIIAWSGGPRGVLERMPLLFEQPVRIQCYPGVGHWIQQEIPAVVNSELISFFDSKPTSRSLALPSSREGPSQPPRARL